MDNFTFICAKSHTLRIETNETLQHVLFRTQFKCSNTWKYIEKTEKYLVLRSCEQVRSTSSSSEIKDWSHSSAQKALKIN